jgi:hypothetical protein
VGKFLLPRPGYPVDYKSEKEMYWHIGEKDVSWSLMIEPEANNLDTRTMAYATSILGSRCQVRMTGIPTLNEAYIHRGHRYVKWVGPLYYMPPAHSGVQKYGWGWSPEYTD